mmetsp:Transcript_35918/g.54607  ORF Transcript_35918/g.54607 Transcript_35918/m.54607 type:complete len:255 (-) Transcript_35918:211-975(-)
MPSVIGGSTKGDGGGGDVEFECVAVLQGHEGDVKDLAFTRSHGYWGEGDEILFSSSYDNTIKLWAEDDDGEWFCAATLSDNVHSSTIWSISATPSGVRLLSASADCTIAIWKFYTPMEWNTIQQQQDGCGEERDISKHGVWKCVGKLPKSHKRVIYSVHCAPLRAGHGRIASGGADNSICIYKEIGGGMSSTSSLSAHHDGFTSHNSPTFVLDASTVNAHDGDINCVKWSPVDGRILVSAGDDGVVNVWKYHMR